MIISAKASLSSMSKRDFDWLNAWFDEVLRLVLSGKLTPNGANLFFSEELRSSC